MKDIRQGWIKKKNRYIRFMFENKNNRTELSSLGEFAIIDRITENIELKNPESIKGIGDDAAVIENGNTLTVVSTDMLVEGVHFDLTDRKSVV